MILYVKDCAFEVCGSTKSVVGIWVKRVGSPFVSFVDNEIETGICIWRNEQKELDAHLSSYKEVLSKFRKLMLLK